MQLLRQHLSIRAQLLVLVLSVVLPAAGIFAYYVVDESQEASAEAYAKVKILAGNTQANLEQLLREHEAVLSRLAARPLVAALDARNCDPLIGEYVRLHPEFTTLAVRDVALVPGRRTQRQVHGWRCLSGAVVQTLVVGADLPHTQ